eukprot:TRINITY_DN6951_c0_g2_i3.p1 TRINITY_DN6951_c0_g2~~TRINITY_DN6951_c0_g2_i3.p1  ORF type:complete len:466 (-),score=64.19 TRINITY_DN6951_c0_g2_i3:49-1446(-)
MMRSYLVYSYLFLLSVTGSLVQITGSTSNSFLYDSFGRVRFFHGIQAVEKGFPWYSEWGLNKTQVELYGSWGINMVRLGWMWSGFNPNPQEFNQTYYEIEKLIVDNFAEAGIYTLLDTHQDCFSSKFCLYDGIPLWVANKSKARDPFPFPFTGDCSRNWEENCLTEAAGQAYQDLYDNVGGMRDDFVNFWSESSQRWKGNTNVIGYELINEPFAGDIYKDPLLLLPGNAGRWNLQPFYAFLSSAIRQNDLDHLIFYEPVTWGMVFEGKVVGSGFSQVPGGDDFRNRSVLSYHYYCSSFGSERVLCDDVIGPEIFRAIGEDLAAMGGSSMLTEFGGPDTIPETVDVMDTADDFLQSWLLWDDFSQVPSGDLKAILIRTYARAVAGKPLTMKFDSKTNDFHFCFLLDLSIKAPTEIFVPVSEKYGGKPNIKTTTNIVGKLSTENNLLELFPTSNIGGEACVDVTVSS